MTLHLDIFSGLSGDMFLGALLDLGVPFEKLEAELRKLGVDGYHLHHRRATKSGIEGVKFDVHLEHEHEHEHGHAAGHSHAHAHSTTHDSGHSHSHSDSQAHSQAHSDSHPHTHEPDHPEVHPGEAHAHEHDAGHGHGHGHDHGHDPDHGRTYAEIRTLIGASSLGDWVKGRSLAVFDRIAIAEGKIHGKPPSEVHFHEVGAVDSIVDVVGACIALDLLGRPAVSAGPVVEGTGFVRCAHGWMPLPAPATLEIFAARGIAVTQCAEPNELITPTGAAILAEFAESFGPLTGLQSCRIGYGLGTRDNPSRPNVVRAILGEPASASASASASAITAPDWETDTIAILETNLDDVAAEVLGHFVERALEAGALDVFHTPVQMKKSRPGVLLTVLCPIDAADALSRLILTETSAFGVRQTQASRRKLVREFRQVTTEHGEIVVKLGRLGGSIVQAAPEFESCRRAANAAGIPLKAVYEAALRAL